MASNLSALLLISAEANIVPSSPYEGPGVRATLNNGSSGARLTDGTGSGQADRVYRKSGTLAASATDTINLLAAGSLTDALGQAIDLDELKQLVVKCVTGSIKVVRPSSNGLTFFVAANDGINLSAGQTNATDFGAGGLALSTNATFEITDTAGGSGSTYELYLVGAQ